MALSKLPLHRRQMPLDALLQLQADLAHLAHLAEYTIATHPLILHRLPIPLPLSLPAPSISTAPFLLFPPMRVRCHWACLAYSSQVQAEAQMAAQRSTIPHGMTVITVSIRT